MNGINSNAAINISLRSFQILEVEKEKNQFKIVKINETFFENPLNFNTQKDTSFLAQLQNSFDEVNLTQPLKCTHVSFTLPQEIIFSVQLPYDNTLLRKDLIEEFRWELSLLLPFISGDELVIQFVQLKQNLLNKKHTAFVMAVEKKYLMLIKNFCIRNKLELKFIDSAIITTNRLVNSLKKSSDKGLMLNIIFSSNAFTFILNENGKPAYVKTFSESKTDSIAEIINKELSSTQLNNIRKNILNEAYICGEDISSETVSQLRLTTGLNFIKLNPFSNLLIDPRIANQHMITERYNSFTAVAGMAYRLA